MVELVTHSDSTAPRTALLLANGDELPYRVLRCLADAGLRVHVLGAREGSARRLTHSVHCRSIDFVPLDEFVSGAAVAKINTLVQTLGIDLVVPSDQDTTRFLAWHGEKVQAPHFPVLPGPMFERLVNKDSFAAVCEELGLPHPKTRIFADAAHALAFFDQEPGGRAFIVKPTDGFASIGVWRMETGSAEARRQLGDVAYRPILVQEFVPGSDVNVLLLCDRGSIASSIAYELDSSHYRVIEHAAILRLLEPLAASLQLHGAVGFDFRRDLQGHYWILECNPRFTFHGCLTSLLAGTNLVKAKLLPGSTPRTAPSMTLRNAKLLRPWTLVSEDRRHAGYLLADARYNAVLAINLFVKAKLRNTWA